MTASPLTIFVNQNAACFVQIFRPAGTKRMQEKGEITRVRHISRNEALRFADFYRIDALKERLVRR